MTATTFILADGIPAPLIFGGIAFLFWLITNVAGKAKKPDTPPGMPRRTESAMERNLAGIRERIRQQAAGTPKSGNRPPPLPMKPPIKQPAPQAQRSGAPRRNPQPPAPAPAPAPRARPVRTSVIQESEPVAVVTNRGVTTSEVSRNVRLLLQRDSVREAFVLGEVLGKPKSMQ